MDLNSENRDRPERFIQVHEPWEALANAIIKTACDDYKSYLGEGRQRIEKFFRSDYFANISNIDPDYLIQNLRKTFRPKLKTINRRLP